MKKKLTRNPLSYQNILCFTADEIQAYLAGQQPPELRRKIFDHLNKNRCANCRRIYKDLTACGDSQAVIEEEYDSREYNMENAKIFSLPVRMRPATPEKLAAGQMWSTTARPMDARGQILATIGLARPVVIIKEGDGERTLTNIIRVLPVTPDTDYKIRGEDMILESSPLGYAAMLEIWNEKPMLAGNLVSYLGKLSPAELRCLDDTRNSFLLAVKSKRLTKEIKSWREQEIELTNYLNYPVNQSIWDDRGEIVICVPKHDYALAAADTTLEALGDIPLFPLCEEPIFSAYILLKRQMIILRVVTDEKTPPEAFIDNNRKAFAAAHPQGIYDFYLGKCDELPEKMTVRIAAASEERVFDVVFEKENESN